MASVTIAPEVPAAAAASEQPGDSKYASIFCAPKTVVLKVVCVLHWILIAAALLFVLLWLIPTFLGPAVAELARNISQKMTKTQVGVMCVVGIWLLTMLFVPSQPVSWLAIFVFGNSFPIGLLITELGTTLGFVCAFVLGRTVISKRAMRLLNKYEGTKAILLAVDRLGAFKVVAMLRFGPLPYSFVSYVSAVPGNVPFTSYFAASFLALLPRNCATVLLGTSFGGLADLFAGKMGNVWSLVLNLVALFVSLLVIFGGTIYCRRIMAQIVEEQAARQADEAERAVRAKADDSAGALYVQTALEAKAGAAVEPQQHENTSDSRDQQAMV